MKYYSYDNDSKELEIKDKKGNLLKTVIIRPMDFSREQKIGIICNCIARGMSLSRVCKYPWSPTKVDFFIWVKSSELFKEMYINATEIRKNLIEEQIMQERMEAGAEYSDRRNAALQKALDAMDKDPGRTVVKMIDWASHIKDDKGLIE